MKSDDHLKIKIADKFEASASGRFAISILLILLAGAALGRVFGYW